jgi:hypothetical protein
MNFQVINLSNLIVFLKQIFRFRFSVILTIIILLICSGKAKAQEIQVVNVDSSLFPNIKMGILYKGKTKFVQDELSILQNERKIPYTIQESAPGSAPEKGRTVYFLIESSGNTYGKAISVLKDGVKGALDNLDDQDLVNAGYFGSMALDSLGLQMINERFTDKKESFSTKLDNKIITKPDSLYRSDLYKSIFESLEYIENQKDLPSNKLFVVLSVARNNSTSTISSAECISKARDLGIPVYAVTYLSNDSVYSSGMITRICAKTGGKNIQCRSSVEVINAITDFINSPIPQSMQEAAYDLLFAVFTDKLPESSITLDLNYKGNRQIFTVSDPNSGSLIPQDFKKYIWISIGILGVIVIFMLLINALGKKNKNNIQENNEETISVQQKDETIISTPERLKIQQSPNTIQNTSSGPAILVSIGGRTNTYSLLFPETKIGRDTKNDVVIPEQTVTKYHAVIKWDKTKIEIEDLGSTNGTFVNGDRIRKSELKHGDRIKLGLVELTLKE